MGKVIHFSIALVFAGILMSATMLPVASVAEPTSQAARAPVVVTHYRTTKVKGVDLFYREAGPANALVVLLMHGFPTSSHIFRNLIPLLADRYHVIAPDYPGIGQSAAPDHKAFAYQTPR